MRIISKFHDYYDIGLSAGQDPSIVFVRQEVEAELGDYPSLLKLPIPDLSISSATRWELHNFEGGVLLVAGKMYRYYHTKVRIDSFKPIEQIWCFTYDDVVALQARDLEYAAYPFSGLVPKKEVGDLRKRWGRYYGYFQDVDPSKLTWLNEEPIDVRSLTAEAGLTIVDIPNIANRGLDPKRKITINPVLKDFNFQRVLDPWTCFQELSMYVGGVLPRQAPDMVEISERDKVMQKGFDPVYGFRKRPKTDD